MGRPRPDRRPDEHPDGGRPGGIRIDPAAEEIDNRARRRGDPDHQVARRGCHAERDAQTARLALFHGPWLLGVDDQLNPFF